MDTGSKRNILLSVSGLTKKYGEITAVNNLSFDVIEGEILGFLGPNGAGKSTSISMIAGLLKPDAGDVCIRGKSVLTAGSKGRQTIGLCPQNVTVWEELTCMEQLQFIGQMYDVPYREAHKRALELLDALGLSEKKDKFARTLSGGMQRRLNIALALVHRPEIVILDEPQAGLDPQSRVLVRDYIRSLARKTTVILTTHEMDEAERLSDRVAIIDHGKLLVCDSPEQLIRAGDADSVLELCILKGRESEIPELLKTLPAGNCRLSYLDGIISVTGVELFNMIPKVVHALSLLNIQVEDLKMRKRSLEDVFIALTGRGLRE